MDYSALAQYLFGQGLDPAAIRRIIEASQIQGQGTPQQYAPRNALQPIGPAYPNGVRR